MNPTYKNLPGNILSNNKASYLKSGSNVGNTRENFSNNFDMGNNRTKNGFNMNNDNYNYNNQNTMGNRRNQQDELNEANESLKLLRLKMNNNNGNNYGNNNAFNQPSNNFGGNSRVNTLSNNNNFGGNNNDNYRKPFKPNVGGDFNNNENLIDINKNNFNAIGGMNQRNMNNNKNPISIPNKKRQVEEVVDDRPAFNEKGEEIFDPDNLEDQEEAEDDDDPNLIACKDCGRKFKEEKLAIHEGVCKQIFKTQRKKFDIKKKRILDSEHAMFLKRSEKEGVDKKLQQVKQQKKQKWKKMSEEFRSIIKANHTTTGFGNFNKDGKPNSTGYPVRSIIEDDYKHCDLCNRRYNENAYDKHLPTCERRAKEAQFKNKGKPGTGSIMTANTTSYANSKPNFNLKFNKK